MLVWRKNGAVQRDGGAPFDAFEICRSVRELILLPALSGEVFGTHNYPSSLNSGTADLTGFRLADECNAVRGGLGVMLHRRSSIDCS